MAYLHGVGIVLLAFAAAHAAEPDLELMPDRLNGSRLCGECHQDIYTSWSRSMHSAAYTDPIFKTSYMKAYLQTGGEASRICLACHAPVAALTDDLELKNEISREGITCDFCHSVEAVNLDGQSERFEVRMDGVKRGPLADADSPVHGVARSDLHKSAELCAGCHEWTNPKGVLVLSTYSEWRTSSHADEGKTCQHCHMPVTSGVMVRTDLGSKPRRVNLHNISGMHSVDQVQRAAEAKILRLRRTEPDLAVVKVEVSNVGSGHFIPTGLPTRKLILEVLLFNNNRLVERFERIYQKVLVDETGSLIVEDHETMLSAARVREDTRLRPGERRVEKFIASVPEQGTLRAEMSLKYSYTPMLLSPQNISIEMARERSP